MTLDEMIRFFEERVKSKRPRIQRIVIEDTVYEVGLSQEAEEAIKRWLIELKGRRMEEEERYRKMGER